MEFLTGYNIHLGPRCEGAGLKIQLHYNQTPGIHFKVEPSELGYRHGIEKGLQDGIKSVLPDFPKDGAVWITEIHEHPVDSSEMAFYRAARLVIEQVAALKRIRAEQKT